MALTSSTERAHGLRVVLFSGGRGSGALTSALVATPGVNLTIAINGYDDGASTGEVRRFLGDALGPSDFRKNASRVAGELRTCPPALIAVLDRRLPDGSDNATVATLAASLQKDEGGGIRHWSRQRRRGGSWCRARRLPSRAVILWPAVPFRRLQCRQSRVCGPVSAGRATLQSRGR